MDARRRERLDRVLDGYFDVRTVTVVSRTIDLASADELESDDAMDHLFASFLERLEERYGRHDDGWATSTEVLLRAEWDRQLADARQFLRAIESED